MHPDYISDRPGSCPICGMDLFKKVGAVDVNAAVKAPDALPNAVRISPDKQQKIGLRTQKVTRQDLRLEIRSAGRVVLDQELFDAQSTYLGSNLLSSKYWNTARQKLLFLGMSEEEVDQLKKTRRADRTLRAVGLTEDAWVYVAVFENEMALVRPGQAATLTAAAFPGEDFQGVVAGVGQTVDPQTRTVRVRLKVADKLKRLRPEMFMAASIAVDLGEKLAVPVEAVMDTGRRKLVHVMTQEETFTPREVTLGRQAGGYYEVIGGLREGDAVVVSGNFLVDAESRLKG